ncbi:MAG: DoxX family protein [Thermoanaerobaculia bacterium]
MKPILARFAESTHALLRIMSGAMFMIHGTQKVLGMPASEHRPPLASMGGVGGLLELICGTLILIGLFTSIAAFIASGEMAVAFFYSHAPHGLIPNLNKGELAVLYCFVFLYLASAGGGAWSLDRALRKGTA